MSDVDPGRFSMWGREALERLPSALRRDGSGRQWAAFTIPVAIDSAGVVSCPGVCRRPPTDGEEIRDYKAADHSSARAYHEVHAQTAVEPPTIHWIEVELEVPAYDPAAAADFARMHLRSAETTHKIREESLAKSRREVERLRALIAAADQGG